MPDEITEPQVQEGTNGAEVEAPARAKMTRADQEAADRAAILAGMDGDEVEETPAAKKSEAKKAPAKSRDEDLDDDEEGVEVDEDDGDEGEEELELADEDDESTESDDEDDEDDDAGAKKEDPELAKRLAKVQKRDARMREQFDAREKAFAKERDAFVAEWKPKVEAYEEFEKLKQRKSDVAGVLKAIGYVEDDFEDISKILWGLSKTGAADPKNRDAVARMQRERELREEAAAARREAAEVKKMLEQRDEDAEANRRVDAYLGRVTKAIGDETPLVKKRLELAPKSTRRAIEKVAYELAKKAGGFVDPKKVVRVYERKLDRTVDHASKLREVKSSSSTTTTNGKSKSTIKVIDKTKDAPAKAAAKAAPTNGKSGALIPSRDDMIERLRKIDRGEIDPDTD